MKLYESKLNDQDVSEISELLKSGDFGFGKYAEYFESEFESFSTNMCNISTNSASGAAFMIFAYLKEKYGVCDVYTPSIGFTSPAWSAHHHGHNLIWVDVDENLLFDVSDYEEERRLRCVRYSDGGVTPVVMPILYGGVSKIPGLESLRNTGYGEVIVVDSAHCVTPKNPYADFTFFSFHPYKPIAASDGGMISTDYEEARIYFEKYRNFGRAVTPRGYDIDSEGFKFYMNNLNACIALTQLKKYEENLKNRKETFKLVEEKFGSMGHLLPHDKDSSYYFATLICDGDATKTLSNKYPVAKHYPMLHMMKYYSFTQPKVLYNTETLHSRIVNLPLYDISIYNDV